MFYYIQDPPPVRNPAASHSETPTDLSGFDITISWEVSGIICVCIWLCYNIYVTLSKSSCL